MSWSRALFALLVLSTLAMAYVLNRWPAPPPATAVKTFEGLAPVAGRATLDHQGQPESLLPGDEKVAVTR